MNEIAYLKQWLHFKKHRQPSENPSRFIYILPNNGFQLNFWCDVLFNMKINDQEIPEQSVYYLHDQTYSQVILKSNDQSMKQALDYKLELMSILFGMSVNTRFSALRQGLQECFMIVETYIKIRNPSKQQENKMYIRILCQHIKKKTTFTIPQLQKKVAECIIKQPQLFTNNKIFKDLMQIDDISTTNIFINHLMGTFLQSQNKSVNTSIKILSNHITKSFIKQILLKYRNQRLLYSMKDHLLKHGNKQHIELLMELSYKLKIQKQIFKYRNLIGKNNNQQTDSDIMYGIFLEELAGSSFKVMNYFQKFMLENLAGKVIALYKVLQLELGQKLVDFNRIQQYLESSDSIKIFTLLKRSPLSTTQRCLVYYLRQSNFRNPYTNNLLSIKNMKEKVTSVNYNCTQVPDPFLFLPIYRKFWNNQFHKQVLNCCLWIALEHWFIFISTFKSLESSMAYRITENKTKFQQYKKNMSLAMIQFIMEYKPGSFINYYPIQANLPTEVVYLPSFADLILKNQEMMNISWFNLVLSTQYKIILSQVRGLELVLLLVKLRTNSIDGSLAQYLFSLAQSQLQKGKQRVQKTVYKNLTQIIQEFCGSWKFKDRALFIKNTYIDVSLKDDL